MVNREARDTLIELTRRFFCGRLNSCAYEDLCWRNIDFSCGDESLWFTHLRVVFHFADQCVPMSIRFHHLTRKERREIARCILFLKSDLDYEWDEKSLPFSEATRALLHGLTRGRWGARMPNAFGDKRAYPFFRQADLDVLSCRPRLLAG